LQEHHDQVHALPGRESQSEYLGCRMDHDLMAREDWSKLGFANEIEGAKKT